MVERHLRSDEVWGRIPELRRSYQTDDYAELPAFMPEEIHATALKELEALFAEQAQRRDLIIKQSGNTPRKYSNIDRDALTQGSTVVPEIFRSTALYELLEAIVGEKVLPVPYVPEEYIAARLHKAGDVHGWHWDDYTWALVWIFKMPDEDNGGSLEYVKGVPWDQDNPRVEEFVSAGPVIRRHPAVGNAYLLKADTALHRVSTLRYDAERMIVCFSFATVADLEREVDHESMEALYPHSHERHTTGP
ncbi:hypothetical protein [Streptomyces sp. NBRC 109706]|uniref:HalD/BesD family halogenase n=1 Tax=Streptomyces sp. NBRC 109706 TaxID=1550035 RepID=UPI00131E1AFF|nr:hypothetical protein [Streptomyces sp. NBRC 109706]